MAVRWNPGDRASSDPSDDASDRWEPDRTGPEPVPPARPPRSYKAPPTIRTTGEFPAVTGEIRPGPIPFGDLRLVEDVDPADPAEAGSEGPSPGPDGVNGSNGANRSVLEPPDGPVSAPIEGGTVTTFPARSVPGSSSGPGRPSGPGSPGGPAATDPGRASAVDPSPASGPPLRPAGPMPCPSDEDPVFAAETREIRADALRSAPTRSPAEPPPTRARNGAIRPRHVVASRAVPPENQIELPERIRRKVERSEGRPTTPAPDRSTPESASAPAHRVEPTPPAPPSSRPAAPRPEPRDRRETRPPREPASPSGEAAPPPAPPLGPPPAPPPPGRAPAPRGDAPSPREIAPRPRHRPAPDPRPPTGPGDERTGASPSSERPGPGRHGVDRPTPGHPPTPAPGPTPSLIPNPDPAPRPAAQAPDRRPTPPRPEGSGSPEVRPRPVTGGDSPGIRVQAYDEAVGVTRIDPHPDGRLRPWVLGVVVLLVVVALVVGSLVGGGPG